jgi:hypothetical protein
MPIIAPSTTRAIHTLGKRQFTALRMKSMVALPTILSTKLFNSRLLSVKLSMTSKFNRNPTKLVLRMMPQISVPSRNGRIPMSDTSRLLIVSSNRRVLSSSILGSHRNGRGIDFTHVGETVSLGLSRYQWRFTVMVGCSFSLELELAGL